MGGGVHTLNDKRKSAVTLLGVFIFCACVGVIAGNYIKKQVGDANASSANVTVVNNNQVSTIDQGTSTITRFSTVTVKDPTATLGYTLSARITNNSIPSSIVTIYSSSSTACTQSYPCTITADSTPTIILETNGATTSPNNATTQSGDTTDWTVTITMPTNTPQGNYILDIAYNEDPIIPRQCPILTNKTYLQDVTAGTLFTHGTDRERVVLKDRRNNQDYYVQNIVNQDGSCTAWMETNLRYAGDGNWSNIWGYPDDRYATTTALAVSTANPNDNIRPIAQINSGYGLYPSDARYLDEGNTTDYTNTAPNGGFYGYHYSWCAAMGGQADACQEDTYVQPDQSQSICPAGWRLPTGGSGGDFRKMVDALGVTSGTAGVTNLINNFLAVYSGNVFVLRDHSSAGSYSSEGSFWSSTADFYIDPDGGGDGETFYLQAMAFHFMTYGVDISVNRLYNMLSALPIRCIL